MPLIVSTPGVPVRTLAAPLPVIRLPPNDPVGPSTFSIELTAGLPVPTIVSLPSLIVP